MLAFERWKESPHYCLQNSAFGCQVSPNVVSFVILFPKLLGSASSMAGRYVTGIKKAVARRVVPVKMSMANAMTHNN